MPAFFTSKLKPLLGAGRELAMAGVALYGAQQVVGQAGNHIFDRRHKSFQQQMSDSSSLSDIEKTKLSIDFLNRNNQVAVGLEMAHGALSLGFYAGLAKFSSRGLPLRPLLPRSPLALPYTLAAASLAFMSGPLVNILSGSMVDGFNNVAAVEDETSQTPSEKKDTARDELLATSSTCACSDKGKVIVSEGTKIAATMEGAVPGFVTLFTPVNEELFFRGLLFHRLVPVLGPFSAGTFSSVGFAALHRGADGASYIPAAETLMGSWFAALYYATGGRLLIPIACHAGVNTCFISANAMLSGSKKYAYRRLSENPDELPVLTFWERLVTDNVVVLDRLLTFVFELKSLIFGVDDGFLPLDFCGPKESVHSTSIFYDHEHAGVIKAPVLCREDGSVTPLAEALMDLGFACHSKQGEGNFVRVEDMISFYMFQQQVVAFLHSMATRNTRNKEVCEIPFRDLVDSFMKSSDFDDEYRTFATESVLFSFGFDIIRYPSGKITREEWKEKFTSNARAGLLSNLNQDLFVIFCLYNVQERPDATLPEILQAYNDCCVSNEVPEELQKVQDWLEKCK